ncbi:hypothetical protein [Brucella intermedia]|uniref:Uncharacterized protein n=1 Tax=Brucella intermedia M86 TaxID=1234597 RepID=M5JRD3_9HYPH|nr:hypothetical protein [Brucella intermedia]ELT50278.1 hypothetical protein D584_05018 [Brucella intermedia M86]
MAVFTIGGRVILAQALLLTEMFLAVGTGDPDWDSAPPPSTPEEEQQQYTQLAALTDLTALVGLTRTRDKFFVKPDAAGTIPMSDGALYSRTDEPTPYIYVRFQLDLSDASGTTLREHGIFIGTTLAPDVLPGQMYIPSEKVVSFGQMVQVDRFPPIVRDGSISQVFSTIVTM